MSEHARPDAVVALSGEFTEDLSGPGPGTIQRMDAAMRHMQAMDIPRLIVAGAYPFRWRNPPPSALAWLMRDYAIDEGIPKYQIFVQDRSLETVGDALFAKIMFTEPYGWTNLVVATNETHLPRALQIFGRVMGTDYTISGVPAHNVEAIKHQKAQERVGRAVARAVLGRVPAGNTAAIQERLFGIIPGYDDTTSTLRRARLLVGGLLVGRL